MALSWKINATIVNVASQELVETVDVAEVEVAIVVAAEAGDAEEDAIRTVVDVVTKVRNQRLMASMSLIQLDPSRTMNGLDLGQMEDVLTSPNNVCTSMDADAEPMDEEEIVVDPIGTLAQPMLIKIQPRPQERRTIKHRIRMQAAAETVVDTTADVLAVALISVTDS